MLPAYAHGKIIGGAVFYLSISCNLICLDGKGRFVYHSNSSNISDDLKPLLQTLDEGGLILFVTELFENSNVTKLFFAKCSIFNL